LILATQETQCVGKSGGISPVVWEKGRKKTFRFTVYNQPVTNRSIKLINYLPQQNTVGLIYLRI
jgi:hypothetical protein